MGWRMALRLGTVARRGQVHVVRVGRSLQRACRGSGPFITLTSRALVSKSTRRSLRGWLIAEERVEMRG